MLWCPPASSDPVDLVNPDIGGVPHLLQPTIPMVHRPFGMVRLAREPKGYQQERIDSFPLNLPAHRGPAVGRLMPGLGELSPDPAAWGSAYDHDFETCTPYRYGVLLEDTGIVAEMTTTARAACYRFIFPSSDGHVCLALQGDCGFERLDECTVGGYEAFGDVRMYFALRAELPLKVTSLGEADGTRVTLVADTDTLVLRSGISWLSVEQARQNLEAEVAGRSFEQIAGASRDAWNEELGKITVEGGEPTQRRVFYSALYRCCERMYECSENGRYYSPHLGKVCEDGGSPHFTDDWIWDTFRAMHPLHVLIDGDREAARLRSYLRVYEESGGMPYFPKMNGNFPIMNGHHVTAVFADAWAKGLRGFDAELAYEGLRKTAMQETMLPWRAGPLTELDRCYQERGFFPGLPPGAEETVAAVNPGEKRQSVAVSLARAYDDWCLAQLARSLGKEEDAEFFLARADWYRRSYNPAHGFFAPRDESGAWIEPFDAKFSGGQGAREYF
ncbi:MAG: glycoside hydrolase family 92 protein, partial [Victivallales bacterium]|nr:glycoside hydrolase family 92 protein [Victivallales bacterium]